MVGTFNLPDYRGRFLRGQDLGANRDADRAMRTAPNPGGSSGDAIGTLQDDQFRSHSHMMSVGDGTMGTSPSPTPSRFNGANAMTTAAAGGSETRPVNVSVNYLIKL